MTWAAFIAAYARRQGIPRTHAAARVRSVFAEVLVALTESPRVAVPGFGVFEVRTHRARRVRNPATRELMELPSLRVVRFRAAGRVQRSVR